MIEGDVGKIVLEDISFDGVPDLAIAATFGRANQSLDYWIYDPSAKQYVVAGNLPRLTPGPKDKTLTVTVFSDTAMSGELL
jgi:hypothetical protein